MRLYLDDDCVDPLLARLLVHAGHDVELPRDVGLSGKPDPVHLKHAITSARVFVTKNYRDFEYLHDLLMAAQGHHPGIFVVRQDNDPKRDLTPHGIVRAIANLEASNVPIPDGYHVLNHWR